MEKTKRTKEEVNELKRKAVQERWDATIEERLKETGNKDRSAKRFDHSCFQGLRLSDKEKQFIVIFMDPPYLGKKEFKYEAYKKVYKASTENSLRANCSALMKKSKIKEGMVAYQKYALKAHKLEVTTESIEMLRKRANYSVDMFYTRDGDPIPLDKINPDYLCCIDNIEKDKKKGNGDNVIITTKYTLCNRSKAQTELQKLLGIYKGMETMDLSVPIGAEKNAIDTAGDDGEKDGGPRITLNLSVGGS